MKSITIRELHLQTGRWVRHAAATGGVVVTDRGHRVAALVPADAAPVGRPLPDREATIRRRARIPVDSGVYISEMRDRG
jgi:antitoxin (DNA-binding transcriptional repressor) of toxin-antitoxin stability system